MDDDARLRILELLSMRTLVSGGWAFLDGGRQVAVEPTAFATLAGKSVGPAILRSRRRDGSWTPIEEETGSPEPSSWCTALALMAVLKTLPPARFQNSVNWLCRFRGVESHWLWRWKFKLSDTQVDFDPDKFGWGWVPETVSWVFPTAIAMIALRIAHSKGLSDPDLEARISLGTEMLIDRACPAGGWNAGNARVFQVPLDPHIDATAIALLALRAAGEEDSSSIVQRAIQQLLVRTRGCPGIDSLAWTILALHAWRPKIPYQELLDRGGRFRDLVRNPNGIANNATLALSAIALDALNWDRNPFEVQA